MNYTIIVKMTTVLFMMCSGFFHFTLASNRLRFFNFSEIHEDVWNNAMNICNTMNASLVTLYDEEDARVIDQLVFNKSQNGQSWLGLRRSNRNVSTWSDGVIAVNMSHVNVSNGEQICEAFENNTKTGFNCSDRKPFMCYRGSDYFLIEDEAKNWCQAQHYCRKHFTDLVSISNESQSNQVCIKGKNTAFWIGLMHDEWEWVDKSCSTYRKWENINTDITEDCVKQSPPRKGSQVSQLYNFGCTNTAVVLCSKGSVRIKLIEHNLTWEQAFDYCKANHSGLLQIEDEDDQAAVKQWLTFSGVSDAVWIGLRQSRMFGFWIWRDKTVTYSNWKNDKIPEMPLSNHCGVINKADSYTWSDENCSQQLPFLCEEEISYMRK